MDNKQIEEAVEKILSNVLLAHHDDLSKEDDNQVEEAKKQICNLFVSRDKVLVIYKDGSYKIEDKTSAMYSANDLDWLMNIEMEELWLK